MKQILLFLLLQNLLFGCAACQLMIPTAEVKIDLKLEQESLKTAHIRWDFTDTYVSALLIQYDKNDNMTLDPDELKEIKKAMLKYLLANRMVTKVSFAKNPQEDTSTLNPKYKNFSLDVQDQIISFTYDIELNTPLEENSIVSFVFDDQNGFFAFVVTDLKVESSLYSYEPNLYLFTASIVFKKTTPDTTVEKVQTPKTTFQETKQSNLLEQSILKIKDLFSSIKDQSNPLTYITLLIFAYLYGLIHALGPGHGKTLVASYFLTNERSYAKALFVSLMIGVVHTFSAFLLTLIIYFGVNTFLSTFIQDSVYLTTKISALIIIFIAIYLFYTKFKAYKAIKKREQTPFAKMNFRTTPHEPTCSCHSCKVDTNSTDLALIVSAGIIPCPGTTAIFIFAISLELYFAGFLSALVMSLGMSTIIYFSALLSVSIRKKSALQNSSLKKYLEYGSLSIILILGFLLLLT